MRHLLAVALCAQIILVGYVFAATTESGLGFSYNMEQKVQGNGFNNAYLNAAALKISLSNKGHGSGSYNYESKLKIIDGAMFDDITGMSTIVSDRNITLQENADFSYATVGFYMGKSFRWGGFRSLGREEICLKNFGAGVSMNAILDHVDTLSKNIYADIYWKEANSSEESGSIIERRAKSNLDVDAAFTGKVHFGAFIFGKDMKKSDMFLDEDYLGAYSLSKKMSYESSSKLDQVEDDWVPCCSGGFADMNPRDAADFKSAKGIFDCTCFKPAQSS